MKIYIGIIIVLAFLSCKKAEDRRCLKFVGEDAERIIETDLDIDSLFLSDDLYYSLAQGNETKIVLTGGENLLSHIDVRINNGGLSIENDNKCKFLRSYKNKINAKIYVDSITYIYYEGSKKLTSIDTLRSNELRLIIRDGAGSADLTLVNGYTSAIVSNGFGDITLRGKTNYGFLHCNSNGFCDARMLNVDGWLNVFSNTVGVMKINANETVLEATIKQSGNIEYVGTPISSTVHLEGSGKVISLNN
ncbi:GIN domain-containing protein [Brumimicrobium mesophilum]|uniref:GIN domain-containing protein n=1 Tax=Brumimicrobium mesophilum TaxID=392717 RepID=UPI00131D8207|nr:DUF2807 domain-containing protein [Brumimicrobium mesophilum]